jgi:hypothetical protein
MEVHAKEFADMMDREQTAEYIDVTSGALAVWASKRYHDLKSVRIGRKVYYKRADVDEFIGDNSSGPLMNRKRASQYIHRSLRALEDRRCDVKSVKIGRIIRYRKSELDRFLDGQMMP